MLPVKRAVLVFAQVIVYTNLCKAQWAVEDDGCRTPDAGVGTCINIYKCKPITDFLQAAPKPLSQKVRKMLANYQCGLDVNAVKVCCPPNPITSPDRNPINQPPDVSKHKNLRLLPKRCGPLNSDDKLLNGEVTALFEFPWMVLISYKTDRGLDFRCGGTLINDRYILTAAHCITNLGRLSVAGVRLGEHDISKSDDCDTPPEGDTICADPVQDMTVDEIIPHPKYNQSSFSNDIGLLRLSRRANTSVDSVQPICLPIFENVRNPTLTNVIVTGWGRTENASKSNILLKVDIPIMDSVSCKKSYEKIATVTHLHICAGGRNMKDSCAGDSGGPMQIVGNYNSDTRYIQYGVVSFGPVPCGQIGKPGVYTKVAYYLDWILDTIRA